MKTFINLPEMYEDLKARRLKRFGRIELLRIINDGAPYWFVRVVGFDEERDRPRLAKCGSAFGNGYQRFVYLDEAEAKFKQLSDQPESIKEERAQELLRAKNRERFKARMEAGKMHSFKKSAQKQGENNAN